MPSNQGYSYKSHGTNDQYEVLSAMLKSQQPWIPYEFLLSLVNSSDGNAQRGTITAPAITVAAQPTRTPTTTRTRKSKTKSSIFFIPTPALGTSLVTYPLISSPFCLCIACPSAIALPTDLSARARKLDRPGIGVGGLLAARTTTPTPTAAPTTTMAKAVPGTQHLQATATLLARRARSSGPARSISVLVRRYEE
ncbi:hypothetical protein O1611_g7610 [Lasiodiplodia mahajangana]|uniref:Uncharacterized protein n=1 Tax=Lasiodiplodia mahajangana TaxID=1108764 RepID=A0ACC2JFA3_9PEZI|nr:hypothetical protein O1611_g7610 [Lasiodiplodia mahajangana]